MSGFGPQPAPQKPGTRPEGRSPLAHLLHALNQPLTGLQCSLELAVSGRRHTEEYIRTLREGLALTERMRILVEALRELTDTQSNPEAFETFQFDGLLRDTVEDLLPVAEERGVRLVLISSVPLPLKADRRCLAPVVFRFLESALALTQKGSDLQIVLAPEPEQVSFTVSWDPGAVPEHSPFSRQELGLLIVQAEFERAGAEWNCTRNKGSQSCMVRFPLISPMQPSSRDHRRGNPESSPAAAAPTDIHSGQSAMLETVPDTLVTTQNSVAPADAVRQSVE